MQVTTTLEILTFMNVASNVIINEAQATNTNGIQECSLTDSFISINPPIYPF